MPRELIRALGLLKQAAAFVNRDLGTLSEEKCRLIAQAAACADAVEVHAQFRIWQTGSGTRIRSRSNLVSANFPR